MKTTKILTILVLASGLVVCQAGVSKAEPMGTAWTYQGRLMEESLPADGLYDFEFKLFDADEYGSQKGSTIIFDDLDVIDGQFSVELDFGSDVFDGEVCWLQTTVAHADGSDPCTLRPRIVITPVPYSLQTRGIFVNDAGIVSIGTKSPEEGWKVYISGNIKAQGQVRGESSYPSTSGVRGTHIDSGNWGYLADENYGVYGEHHDSGNQGFLGTSINGVRGESIYNRGVEGISTNGTGVYGTGLDHGVRGVHSISGKWGSLGNNEHGVYGEDPVSGNSAYLGGSSYAGYFSGDARVTNHIAVGGRYYDSSNDAGNLGQILSSTGSGTDWIDAPTGVGDITSVNAGTGLTGGGNSGDVTLNIEVPLHLSGTTGDPIIMGTNSGNGEGVYGENNNGNYGYLGGSSRGVYGYSPISNGYAVYGRAGYMGTSTNYGGYFFAGGSSGRGVHGESSGSSGKGVYGKATGTNGEGLYGEATGSNGIGIYGEATATAATAIWASATGSSGIGVYSEGEGYDFYAGGPGINYGYSSSVRWKNNIRSIDDALGKVIKLRGVYFNWDEEHGGHHDVGMIAEEVGEILPEIVGYEENGIDATGMDYGKLTPLLVESIKELTKAVNQLKVDNNLMRQRVEALEAMIPQQKIKLIKESQ